MVVSRKSGISCFPHGTLFYLEKLLTNFGSNLVIWQKFSQKWMTWAHHFKENNWQYLLPVIKFWALRKTSAFWKISNCIWSWTAFQYFMYWGECFLMRLLVILCIKRFNGIWSLSALWASLRAASFCSYIHSGIERSASRFSQPH